MKIREMIKVLSKPVLIAWFCAILLTLAVFFNGTALQLWKLNRDRNRLYSEIQNAEMRVKELEQKVWQQEQPEYIERQARDQFDFVRDGDLVFVFPDEENDAVLGR